MWSKDQIAKFRRALDTAAKHKDALEKLAALAQLSPDLAETIRQLQTRRDYLETVASAALAMADQT